MMNAIGVRVINKRTVDLDIQLENNEVKTVRLQKKRDKRAIKRRVKMALRVTSRIAWILATAVSVALLTWIFISWVNVISNNISPDGQIASWNAFEILVKYGTR